MCSRIKTSAVKYMWARQSLLKDEMCLNSDNKSAVIDIKSFCRLYIKIMGIYGAGCPFTLWYTEQPTENSCERVVNVISLNIEYNLLVNVSTKGY